MSKKMFFLIGFFLILTIGFITVLAFVNNGEILTKRFKTVSTVKPFSFVNQNNDTITEHTINGKVTLVEFFFTTCKTVCPKMNNTVKNIYNLYKGNPDFYILSHTSDPKNDNVTRLKHYADSIGASGNWFFLTGTKKDLYEAARKSYALDDEHAIVNDPETDFIHTQLLALVNRKGELKKKVYDSFNKSDMEELKQDIQKELNGDF